jgi:sterol desaturase/sphingolipid hydroxylase (fatty acid hydroxylase superfamily)
MDPWIADHELAIRLGAFAGALVLMALWEVAASVRPLRAAKGRRWLANLGLVALDTLLLRWLFPAAAVGMAWSAAQQQWGLFNRLGWPPLLELVLAVALLDFAIYLQHILFHVLPLLRRFHMVHHTDIDFDVTTGLRFHPVEILLSMLWKLAVITAVGPSLSAVLIFEVILNAMAMFNHANVHLPDPVEPVLRWLVVTPDMHRVHHSVRLEELNSNFGFNLPWWDRLFGTYRAQPRGGHQQMTIGVQSFQEPRLQTLGWMLTFPFTSAAAAGWQSKRPEQSS